MNRRDLVAAIAENAGLDNAAADAALTAYVAVVGQALAAGEAVSVPGFGTFEVRSRAERAGRNPQTGEPITIAAAKSPAFKAASALKLAVNSTDDM